MCSVRTDSMPMDQYWIKQSAMKQHGSTSGMVLRPTRSSSALDKLIWDTPVGYAAAARPASAGPFMGRSLVSPSSSLRIPAVDNGRQGESASGEEETQWKRPDSALRRTLNSFQFENVADKLSISADNRGQEVVRMYSDGSEADIINVMAYMRQRATTSQIFFADFFRNYDSYRKGYISAENFYRAISDMGCFKDMSHEEKDLVVHTFSEPRPLNFKRHVFNYAAFAEVLQPCNDSRIKLSEKYVNLKEFLANQRDMPLDSPYAIRPLTLKGEERIQTIKRRLQHKVISTRISVREILGDFDPHLNTTILGHMKQQYKHTQFLCNIPGCISRSQYLRGMVRLAGDMDLSPEDLDLIYMKYERNGAFNYYAFCKDIDSPVDLIRNPTRTLSMPANHLTLSPARSPDSSPMAAVRSLNSSPVAAARPRSNSPIAAARPASAFAMNGRSKFFAGHSTNIGPAWQPVG